MVLPLVGLLLALFVHVGLVLADVVAAQGIAREVARVAAVDGDAEGRAVLDRFAGQREATLQLVHDDGAVEARVRLRSDAFSALGVTPWLPARAAMRVEAPSTVAP